VTRPPPRSRTGSVVVNYRTNTRDMIIVKNRFFFKPKGDEKLNLMEWDHAHIKGREPLPYRNPTSSSAWLSKARTDSYNCRSGAGIILSSIEQHKVTHNTHYIDTGTVQLTAPRHELHRYYTAQKEYDSSTSENSST